MRNLNKYSTFTILSLLSTSYSAQAAAVFVDFVDGATGGTGSEFYNVSPTPTGVSTAAHPVASTGTISMSGLSDIDGNSTGIGVTLDGYNNGSGQLRGGASTSGGLIHDPVPGINTSASADSFWINNHNSNGTGAGNEFGFVLTFDGLTDEAYDITILAGSSNRSGSWAVTVGLGDADVVGFGTAQEDVLTWTDVVPVGGVITLTGTTVPSNSNFQNTSISFASITSVPEPSAVGLVGLGVFGLLLRKRR